MPAMVLTPLTEAALLGLAAAGLEPEAAGAPDPEAAWVDVPEAAGREPEAAEDPEGAADPEEAAGAVAVGWAPVERRAGVEVRVTPCYATRFVLEVGIFLKRKT